MAHVASHLDPRRFRAAVCTFSAEDSVLTDQLRENGVPIYTLPCKDGLDFRVILRLRTLMQSLQTQVVHCCNPRPILYGGVAARFLRIRGAIGFLSAFACQVPDRTYGFLPQPLTTVSRRNVYRNRIAARLMRYLVTVSRSLGNRFCEYNGLPVEKLRVVPYGADLSAVDGIGADEARRFRRDLGYGPDVVLIGSVGRLVEQKDYPTQLRAFARAAALAPELRMILAGAGPLEEGLRGIARDLGISHLVRFLGHWERVPLLLRSLDIFVLASKFEPFGVALLEAKAAGVAIVATRVNEIPEILTDGESGLLCPAEDSESMAGLLVRLAKDPGLRAHVAAGAVTEARDRHSLEAAVHSYQDLYDASLHATALWSANC